MTTEADKADGSPFADLGLDPRLVRAVTSLGFTAPTPIQVEAIPVLLAGRDVVGGARTGSGKTAAFGLPLLHRVAEGGPVRALVLAPTRELAIQVEEALTSFATALRLGLVCVYGGAPYEPQLKALRRGATVVVGTPGRLIDHLERGSLDLSKVEVVVLDEADEMLRMGFLDDVEKLLQATPPERQVALFSATMPAPIRRIANMYLRDAVEVQVEDEALSVDHISQRFVLVPQSRKLDALQRVLRVAPPGGTLVFARTRAACAEVADALAKAGVGADALHGDLTQAARERVLNRLRAERLDVLVATDVAARGLDVEHLGLVINLDLPESTEVYVHRIGRTGRAGRTGMAISFVTPRERRQIGTMQRTLGVRMEQVEPPTDAEIAAAVRRRLAADLESRVAAVEADVVEWVSALCAERGWTAESVAAAALTALAEGRNAPIVAPAADDRPQRADVSEEGFDAGDPRNEVELFIPLGRRDGVRPQDIVGAIANEAGIPGRDIGRITLFARNSFVGLPAAAAEHLLRDHRILEIRGRAVELSVAQGASAPDRADHPADRDQDRGPRPPFAAKKHRFDKPDRTARGRPAKGPSHHGTKFRR
jgi:ATP-dependent RNA helicase DeaD